MVVPLTEDKWTLARKALAETGDRFAELLDAASRSGARATVHWSVADTAAHVLTLARSYTHLLDPEGVTAPFPESAAAGLVEATTVDTVHRFNEALLSEFTERDPRELGRLIRADIDQILRSSDGEDPARAVAWLGGSEVPLAGVLAHLLNELQIHGRDIALSVRSPWKVAPEEAGLFLDLFLVGVTHYGYGRLLDGHGPAPEGRVAVEFRSRHTTPVVMVLTDGFVTVEKPGGPADVRLWFDPVTLNLMLFGRISKLRAALTGKVVVRGGRRPWTLPSFLRIVRLPS
ncbi:maleylpyruvate isomerase N-terminal domain-containing protein [Actinomadura fulvescens]|uniref:Maleylpyruvate isomerase family mycothiol-dependent enzyme n=1 Tax=Actinomadura fulvescens TaxID=46160 RepID=A0ABN3PRD1_9ACTN